MLGLEEKITLAAHLDDYYETTILHGFLYHMLRKLYYARGASFVMGFLLGADPNILSFLVVLPAYLVSISIRSIRLRGIRDLYVLYYDFAKDIAKSPAGEKSKLLNMIPE